MSMSSLSVSRDTRAWKMQVWVSFALAKTLRDAHEADRAEGTARHDSEGRRTAPPAVPAD